jgi:hypothetical protein
LEFGGANGQWGIFSMAIAGRVGYQCQNRYRACIRDGSIVDPNYIIDEEGVLRYLFGKKENGVGVVRKNKSSGSGGRKWKKRKVLEDGDKDEDEELYKPRLRSRTRGSTSDQDAGLAVDHLPKKMNTQSSMYDLFHFVF